MLTVYKEAPSKTGQQVLCINNANETDEHGIRKLQTATVQSMQTMPLTTAKTNCYTETR